MQHFSESLHLMGALWHGLLTLSKGWVARTFAEPAPGGSAGMPGVLSPSFLSGERSDCSTPWCPSP